MWNWTEIDYHLIEDLGLARVMQLYPVLLKTWLHLDEDYVLNIHACNSENIKCLKFVWAELRQQAYFTLGIRDVWLWFEGEVIVQSAIGLKSAVDIRNDDEGSNMTTATATATVERSNTTTVIEDLQPSTFVDNKLPGQTIAAVAEDTEQPIEAVRAWIQEHNWQIIPFNGEEVIAGDVAIAAIDHFTMLLIQQRKAKRGLQTGAPAETNGAAKSPAPEPVAAAPEKVAPAKASRSSLVLPSGYANKVAKSTRLSLERALPQRPQARSEYLEQIVSETDKGKAFLDKVAAAITRKFGGTKEKTIANLLEMAKRMQGEMQTA